MFSTNERMKKKTRKWLSQLLCFVYFLFIFLCFVLFESLLKTTFNKIFGGFVQPSSNHFLTIVINELANFQINLSHTQRQTIFFFSLSIVKKSIHIAVNKRTHISRSHNEVVSKNKLENWLRFFSFFGNNQDREHFFTSSNMTS